MGAKRQESALNLLRDFLGLTSSSRPDSPNFRPPIFISIPTLSTRNKTELPLTLAILDLLDLSTISSQNLLSNHTFTSSLPLHWTKTPDSPTSKISSHAILVTKSFISLSHLLPENRELVFVSAGVGTDFRPINSLLRSLGLNAKTKIIGIFDIEMFARDVAALELSSSISPALKRLQEGMEDNVTEFMLRAMLLLVLETCKIESYDEVGRAWVACLREIGTRSPLANSPMEKVKKVGKAIFGKVKRSAEEIWRVRAEREKRRQWREEVGVCEGFVNEMRLWDGMWELID
jgi:hypothetical protein